MKDPEQTREALRQACQDVLKTYLRAQYGWGTPVKLMYTMKSATDTYQREYDMNTMDTCQLFIDHQCDLCTSLWAEMFCGGDEDVEDAVDMASEKLAMMDDMWSIA